MREIIKGSIRYATTADIPAIIALGNQCRQLHNEHLPTFAQDNMPPWDEDVVQDLIDYDEDTYVYVFTVSDKVIAFAITELGRLYNKNHSMILYLQDICVDEKCRGKNIGFALIEHILRTQKAIHHNLIAWRCDIYDFNIASQNLAKTMGYKPLMSVTETTYSFDQFEWLDFKVQ
jgi:ribosomal protein S18 acetylase RimI-like enzyme